MVCWYWRKTRIFHTVSFFHNCVLSLLSSHYIRTSAFWCLTIIKNWPIMDQVWIARILHVCSMDCISQALIAAAQFTNISTSRLVIRLPPVMRSSTVTDNGRTCVLCGSLTSIAGLEESRRAHRFQLFFLIFRWNKSLNNTLHSAPQTLGTI